MTPSRAPERQRDRPGAEIHAYDRPGLVADSAGHSKDAAGNRSGIQTAFSKCNHTMTACSHGGENQSETILPRPAAVSTSTLALSQSSSAARASAASRRTRQAHDRTHRAFSGRWNGAIARAPSARDTSRPRRGHRRVPIGPPRRTGVRGAAGRGRPAGRLSEMRDPVTQARGARHHRVGTRPALGDDVGAGRARRPQRYDVLSGPTPADSTAVRGRPLPSALQLPRS